jgi:predicted RNA-binding Zn-ribbon protein involved in translation (DUF1610 family)
MEKCYSCGKELEDNEVYICDKCGDKFCSSCMDSGNEWCESCSDDLEDELLATFILSRL